MPTSANAAAQARPTRGPELVLVVGPPRSGTTLVGRLLAGSGQVLSLSEPLLAHAVLPDWRLHRVFQQVQSSGRLRHVRLPVRASEARFRRYLSALASRNGFHWLVLKETFRGTGLNPMWRNEERLAGLAAECNGVVGLIRDPYDTAASTLKLAWWVMGWRGALARLRAPNMYRFASRESAVRWAAENWAAYVDWARSLDLRIVRYEAIVEDVAAGMRSLCEASGLPFDESMTQVGGRQAFGGIGDISVLRNPRRSVGRVALGRGRMLTAEERAIVREVCSEKAASLGYEL